MDKLSLIASGDIHLNLRAKKLYHWERTRYLSLMTTLALHPSKTVILSGDIFDLPHITLDEQQTFYEGISILNDAEKDVYIIGGNHENLDKKLTTFDKIPHVGFTYIKNDKMFSTKYFDVYCVEHLSIHDIKDLVLDTRKTNILFSHFRSNLGMIKEEVDVHTISTMFDYVVVSDIHSYHKPYENIFYTSSPYGLHYNHKTDYGFLEININKNEVQIEKVLLDLPSKYKVTATPSTAAKVTKYLKDNDYISVQVTGTPSQLEDLPDITSKFVTYNKKVEEVDDDILAGMVTDLAKEGNFDVYDTIKKLVRDAVLAGDSEYILTLGEEQIDEIQREIG